MTHHSGQDGDSGGNLWPEPVWRLDVLVLLKDRVVDGKLLLDFLCVSTATDGTLDLLFKLGAGSLL